MRQPINKKKGNKIKIVISGVGSFSVRNSDPEEKFDNYIFI